MCMYGEDAMRFLSDVAAGFSRRLLLLVLLLLLPLPPHLPLRFAAADLSDINSLFVCCWF